MGEAIIFSILMLLSIFGIQKIFEYIQRVTHKEGKGQAVLVYKMENDCNNAEMLVRSLAADAEEILSVKGCALVILDDDIDECTKKICIDTAQQYQNVVVSSIHNLNKIIN